MPTASPPKKKTSRKTSILAGDPKHSRYFENQDLPIAQRNVFTDRYNYATPYEDQPTPNDFGRSAGPKYTVRDNPRSPSPVTIGMEVEKLSLAGVTTPTYVKPTPLFKQWYQDGGPEGCTHPYGINNRKELVKHAEMAAEYLNAPISESRGGHTTLKGKNITLRNIRKCAHWILALWPQRARRHGFVQNMFLSPGKSKGAYRKREENSWEIRFPDGIANVQDFIWRFDFFSAIARACQTKDPRKSIDSAMKRLLPLRPNTNAEQAEAIKEIAEDCKVYLEEGILTPKMMSFFPPRSREQMKSPS